MSRAIGGLIISVLVTIVVLVLTIISMSDGVEGTEVEGVIDTNTRWTLDGSPYIITDSLDIQRNVELRIKPGVEVHLYRGASLNTNSQVGYGTILIEGTLVDRVLLKVIPSDLPEMYQSGFNSGPDADLRNATFEGLRISIGEGATVSHCIVKDVMVDSEYSGSLDIRGSTATLYRCEVWDARNAFYLGRSYSQHIRIIECKAFDSTNGFYLRHGNDGINRVTVDGCSAIECSTGFNIYNSGSETLLVDCIALDCSIGYNMSSNFDCRLLRCVAKSCTVRGFTTRGHTTLEAKYYLDGFVTDSCNEGIYLWFPGYMEISNGSFNNNVVSIHIDRFNDFYPNKRFYVHIWENNFVGGRVKFTDSELQPTWWRDRRGNYWDTYSGEDVNSDGIGDAPHTIAPDNFDIYPLMARQDHIAPIAFAGRPVTKDQSLAFYLDGSGSADDIGIVSWTWIIHLPGGDETVSGSRVTFSIADAGDYMMTLEVMDRSGSSGSDWGRIHIWDTEGPTFDSLVVPSHGYTGENVTFGCVVTDLVGVSQVWVKITFEGSGTWQSSTMSRTYDGGWALDVLIPLDHQGTVTYKYKATDREGNEGETEPLTFSVLDNKSPTVRLPTIKVDFKTGETRDITCQAEDNWDVANVVMEYWFGDSEPNFHSMKDLDNTWNGWEASITIPFDDISPLHFKFNASDESGNWVITDTITIDVVDGEAPMITKVMDDVEFYRGESTRFSVSVHDHISTPQVHLLTKFIDEDWNRTRMELDDGLYITWLTLPLTGPPTFDYQFEAVDETGNTNRSEVQIASLNSARPHIGPVPSTDAYEGSEFSVVLTVEDLDGVPGEHQWTLQTGPSWLSVDFDDGELKGTPGEEDIGVWTVEVMVGDFDNNVDSITFNITVHDVNFRPAVDIISPEEGTTIKKRVTIAGKASDDDDRIEWVRYRIDDGDWLDVTGTTSWTFELNPQEMKDGDHIIEVMAYDGFNESKAASLSVKTKKERDEGPGFEGFLSIVGIIATASIVAVLGRRSYR